MPQVSDVARQVLAAISSDAGHVLVAQWVARRYAEMVTKVRFRQLRRVGELVQPATIADGTVTVTQNSTTVTPDATALAAWTALPLEALVGRYFRGQDAEWYRIEQVSAAGVLTLESPYVIESAADVGYVIAARYLQLASDARWLGTFVHMRRQAALDTVSLDALDLEAPSRPWAQGTPRVVAEVGVVPGVPNAVGGVRLVEVYPYPRVDELIHYVYWSLPLTLEFDDEVPRFIPEYTLVEGALIDAMRYKMAKALDAGQAESAATWRNEYRAQETKWKGLLDDAVRADRGVDDLSFLVKGYGGVAGPGFIRTAHGEIYERAWDNGL